MLKDKDFSASNIYQLFERQVHSHPQKNAIIIGEQTISYHALAERIGKFSNVLLTQADSITKKNPIAIALPAGLDFIVAIFACLKCGIPYIPFNIDYPDEYLSDILKDAGIAAIITDDCQRNRKIFTTLNLISIATISLNDNVIMPDVHPTDAAYIIYTSGSTGSPKGVIIQHKNIINLMQATQKIYAIDSNDSIPLFHSLAFDFSVWEIFSALLTGACLLLPPSEVRQSPSDYIHYLIQFKVTIVNFTPSLFYRFSAEIQLKQWDCPALRLIILGGEIFLPKKAREWFQSLLIKHAKLYNMYGITEGTIHVTAIEVTEQMQNDEYSLIGNALEGVKIALIAEDGSANVNKGELCIGGFAVAEAYLGNLELTQKKFFANSEGWWFKSGDLVEQTNQGLIYLGRIDNIVKIRGYRVNCLEVAAFLLKQSNVHDAVVTTFQLDGETRLIAFLQAKIDDINLDAIKKSMQQHLPSFMMPSRFVTVKKFPLTSNGKIDMVCLLENILKEKEWPDLTDTFEQKVARAWQDVLNISNISMDMNFFEAGGDSLLLIKLQYLLQQAFDKQIAVLDLIRYPTVNKFVYFMRERADVA
jgi:amino acid adenylation domain-containing protein